MNVVTQLTQLVGHDVINKNTTDLAVRCSTDSVELSCVAINTPLGMRLLFRNVYVYVKSVAAKEAIDPTAKNP